MNNDYFNQSFIKTVYAAILLLLMEENFSLRFNTYIKCCINFCITTMELNL